MQVSTTRFIRYRLFVTIGYRKYQLQSIKSSTLIIVEPVYYITIIYHSSCFLNDRYVAHLLFTLTTGICESIAAACAHQQLLYTSPLSGVGSNKKVGGHTNRQDEWVGPKAVACGN